MQDYHYNYIKNKYGDRAEMLLTDTDSLMHKIEVDIADGDFPKEKELFEFSNYRKDSKYYNNAKNLFVVKKKDETSEYL